MRLKIKLWDIFFVSINISTNKVITKLNIPFFVILFPLHHANVYKEDHSNKIIQINNTTNRHTHTVMAHSLYLATFLWLVARIFTQPVYEDSVMNT